MVGNICEWTSGQIDTAIGLDNGLDGLWLGQTFPTVSYALIVSIGGGSYDILRALPKSSSASIIYASGDAYYYSSGIRAPRRGGNRADYSNDGRWLIDLSGAPSTADSTSGFRCSF